MHRETQRYTEINFFIRLFNFYVFSNLHVALATFFLVKITLTTIGISENNTAWFVFFSTLTSYNIIRFLRIDTIKNWYNLWIIHYKKQLQILTLIGVIGVVYFGFQLRLKAILILIPFALATFFYVFPLKKYSLRNIAGLKLFLIAFSWAGITALFPLTQNYMQFRFVDWLVFIQRFLFVIAITIPFDIRDVNYDVSELKTIPQQLGIYKTKLLGSSLLFIFILLEFIKSIDERQLISSILIAAISSLLLYFSTSKQSKYYSAFFVESLPIIWYLLIT